MMVVLNFIINILILVFILGLLILVHELGHFIIAKLTGMYVEEFSLGMGPQIFSKKVGETEYSLRMFPIGGFVRILGEDYDDAVENAMETIGGKIGKKKDTIKINEKSKKIKTKVDLRNFSNQPLLSRMLVITAGVVMNVVFAGFIYTGILWSENFEWKLDPYMMDKSPIFGEVKKVWEKNIAYNLSEDGGANDANWPESGEIISIDGINIIFSADFSEIVRSMSNEVHDFNICEPGGENCSIYSTKVSKDGFVGVYLESNYSLMINYNGVARIFSGFAHMVNQVQILTNFLPRYVRSAIKSKNYEAIAVGTVSSPIGLYFVINAIKNDGVKSLLDITANMSMMLAIVNILPIPALDGGRLLLLIIEGIFGKPMNRKLEGSLIQISFYALMVFMVLVVFKDILFIKSLMDLFQ